ncbi:MAG: NAD(P)-binding protein [Actinomycetaceae bacterium]|nr:NAD(P)-binding protein [Actinomycetaceae bacterium]
MVEIQVTKQEATQPFAVALNIGSSFANHTGSWRSERPIYENLLPPCNKQCPAGENIQRWLFHAEEGNYEAAWREIMKNNPLPAVMGRVCYHTCQLACNRGKVDKAVGINSVERFLGDKALAKGWKVEPVNPDSNMRVLVVGAGPSGLSAAYHLRRFGHSVTVCDSSEKPGGMMRYGIPTYRLPRHILDGEIRRIADMGVEFRMNTTVSDVDAALEEYDAVFLAVGQQLGRNVGIPAGTAKHVRDAVVQDAVHMLRNVEEEGEAEHGEKPLMGRTVVVYGGGNTAVDAARTAKRLGASDSIILYRRTRDKMPAHEFEVREAEEEGITFRWLSTISGITEGEVMIEKMELGEDGFPVPTGEYEKLDADSVVMALGQESDLSLLEDVEGVDFTNGVVHVDSTFATGRAGLFAGGDMIPQEKNVTAAIGHGKQAARNIDAYLRQTLYVHPPAHKDATIDRMETWYYAEAPKQVRDKLDGIRRSSNFDEVVLGLDEETALFEARRCMSCGNCFGCDNCFGVCPDNAIEKIEPGRYEIKYDYCKGCGICAQECPCGAISMVPETN